MMAPAITWKRTSKQSMARVAGCDLISQYNKTTRRWLTMVMVYGQPKGLAFCDSQAEGERHAEETYRSL